MDEYNFSQLLNKIPCVALLATRNTYYIDIARAKGEALVNIIVVYF